MAEPFLLNLKTSQAAFLGVVLSLLLTGCSGKKIRTTPELSKLEGKKVALVEVEGESTARNIVEVALVNQLVRTGYFELVSKQDIQSARAAVDTDSSNPLAVARKAGADYALLAKVLSFDAHESKGYSEEKVHDTQLEQETGSGETTRVYTVKRLDGRVAVELNFTDVQPSGNGEVRSAVAEKSEQVTAEAKTEAAHLPPRLRFLEKLSNEAFRDFFEKYK
jgi:hypothetical protein